MRLSFNIRPKVSNKDLIFLCYIVDVLLLLPENMATHIAEDSVNRYVANQDAIGNRPVTSKAITEAIAHPRYADDAYGDLILF